MGLARSHGSWDDTPSVVCARCRVLAQNAAVYSPGSLPERPLSHTVEGADEKKSGP